MSRVCETVVAQNLEGGLTEAGGRARELTLVNIQQVNKSESAKGRGSEEPTRNSRYEYEYQLPSLQAAPTLP